MRTRSPRGRARPPTDALLKRAQAVYAELGRTLTGVQVGSSARRRGRGRDRHAVDRRLRDLGDGAHGPDDHADLGSIVPRVYLLARCSWSSAATRPRSRLRRRSRTERVQCDDGARLRCG